MLTQIEGALRFRSVTEMLVHQCTEYEKQHELDMLVSSQSCNVTGETWWDECHDWSAVSGLQLFSRDEQGRQGGGVALSVKGEL